MENPPPKLKAGRMLGQGAFATVHKAHHVSGVVAVKVLRPEYANNLKATRMLLREAALTSRLTHPHIVRYQSMCQVAVGPNYQAQGLIMEYMESGSLADLLSEQMKQPKEQLYTDAEALTWLLQIADALSYLHQRDPAIIHRDVKPANVLLTPSGPSGKVGARSLGLHKVRLIAKLCDFGLHQVVRPGDHRPLLRINSFVAHASASAIFHNPRVSEDGSLVLPQSLLRTCERFRGHTTSSGAVTAALLSSPSAAVAATRTPITATSHGGLGNALISQCSLGPLDTAVLSCEDMSLGHREGGRKHVTLGSPMSLLNLTKCHLVELPATHLPLQPQQQQIRADLHKTVSGVVESVADAATCRDLGGSIADLSGLSSPFKSMSATGDGARAMTGAVVLAIGMANTNANNAQAHRMRPAASISAAWAPTISASRLAIAAAPLPERASSSEQRPEKPARRTEKIRDGDEGGYREERIVAVAVGGNGRVRDLKDELDEGSRGEPQLLQPYVDRYVLSAATGAAATSSPTGRLEGWIQRQAPSLCDRSSHSRQDTSVGSAPRATGAEVAGGAAVAVALRATSSACHQPAGGAVPFYKTATAPRDSATLRPMENQVNIPLGQHRRSYSLGITALSSGGGGLGLDGSTLGTEGSSQVPCLDSGLETPLLERVFNFSGQCGSSIYMSPEVALEQPYNEKADVFSFGIMCFEVFSRKLISLTQEGRDGFGFTRMMVDGRRPGLPPALDPRVADLVRACWHADPLERPSMQQVVTILQDVLYGDLAITTPTQGTSRAAHNNASSIGSGSTAAYPSGKDEVSVTGRHTASSLNPRASGQGDAATAQDMQSLRTEEGPLSLELSASLPRSKVQLRLLSMVSTGAGNPMTVGPNTNTNTNTSTSFITNPAVTAAGMTPSSATVEDLTLYVASGVMDPGGVASGVRQSPQNCKHFPVEGKEQGAPQHSAPPELHGVSLCCTSPNLYTTGGGIGAASMMLVAPSELLLQQSAGQLPDAVASSASVVMNHGTIEAPTISQPTFHHHANFRVSSRVDSGRQAAAAAIAAVAAATAAKGNGIVASPARLIQLGSNRTVPHQGEASKAGTIAKEPVSLGTSRCVLPVSNAASVLSSSCTMQLASPLSLVSETTGLSYPDEAAEATVTSPAAGFAATGRSHRFPADGSRVADRPEKPQYSPRCCVIC